MKDLDILKQYIIDKTSSYIEYLKIINYQENGHKTNIIINYYNKKNDNLKKDQDNINNKITFKIKSQNNDKRNDDKMINSQDILYNKNKLNKKLNDGKKINQEKLSENKLEDFKEYLAPDIDDLEFEDILLIDKRTFKDYFIESLNEKLIFLKTFKVKDNFLPTSLKVILLTLTLVLYIVINGFFYGDDDISEIYHIEGEDTFFGFFPRSIERYVYSAIVGTIIGIIVDLFFIPESEMKKIFKRNKNNISNLKFKIVSLSKNIIIRYIIFVIFVLVLFLLLMVYLL